MAVHSIYIVIYSPDLLLFACRRSVKLLSLCILCNKWNFSDTPSGSLPGVPSPFHITNGFTVKHRGSARISCQCDTNRTGHFTLDANASRPVACALLKSHDKCPRGHADRSGVDHFYHRMTHRFVSTKNDWTTIKIPTADNQSQGHFTRYSTIKCNTCDFGSQKTQHSLPIPI